MLKFLGIVFLFLVFFFVFLAIFAVYKIKATLQSLLGAPSVRSPDSSPPTEDVSDIVIDVEVESKPDECR